MVLPSDLNPTVLGLVQRIVWAFFYSLMPPRIERGLTEFFGWLEEVLLNVFLELFLDIGLRFTCFTSFKIFDDFDYHCDDFGYWQVFH